MMMSFSVAAGVNFFSVTFLLIIAAIGNQQILAADLALGQAVVMLVFYSLSANARSLVLRDDSNIVDVFLKFRLSLIIPAIIAALMIGLLSGISMLIIVLLTIRKAFDWFVEIILVADERNGQTRVATNYILLNTSVLFFLAVIMIAEPDWVIAALALWAIMPVVSLLKGQQNFSADLSAVSSSSFKSLFPQIGSTSVISLSMFLFRLMIVYFVGKSVAGELFAAFSVGGVMASVYTQTVGPRFVLTRPKKAMSILLIMAGFMLLVGVLLWLALYYFNFDKPLFVWTSLFSLLGGIAMLFAQHERLLILKQRQKHTFWPDFVSNAGLLILVPAMSWSFGNESLSLAFLVSGLLSYGCYKAIKFAN